MQFENRQKTEAMRGIHEISATLPAASNGPHRVDRVTAGWNPLAFSDPQKTSLPTTLIRSKGPSATPFNTRSKGFPMVTSQSFTILGPFGITSTSQRERIALRARTTMKRNLPIPSQKSNVRIVLYCCHSYHVRSSSHVPPVGPDCIEGSLMSALYLPSI